MISMLSSESSRIERSNSRRSRAIFSRVADTALVDMLYMGVILSGYGRFSTALDESGRMIRDRVFEN